MTVVVTTVFWVAEEVEEPEDDGVELVKLLVELAAFPIVVKVDGFAIRSQRPGSPVSSPSQAHRADV